MEWSARPKADLYALSSAHMLDTLFLGRYRVLRQLGEGGMGKVYLARQTDLNRDVVIKVMHEHVASESRFQERFQQEMLAMAQFQHPYAVTLYDAHIETDEGPAIIMEYVKGKTLDLVLKENKYFSPQRASRLLTQLCEVLSTAHQQGIIHRDLKPSNLMVTDPDTQFEKIKVMDFGLAKLAKLTPVGHQHQTSYHQQTASGENLLGTPAYVSPEQARGDHVTHRSDLYSVGVILYEMLTGRLPFQGLSTMDTLLAHAIEQPPAMTDEDIVVPDSIEQVVLRCMAKAPEERYNSSRELLDDYLRALALPDGRQLAAPQRDDPTDLPPIPHTLDPNVMVFRIQAWMPRTIASVKLAGFIQDARGEVIENSPGRVRVILGAKNTAYRPTRVGWFSVARADIEMELQIFESTNPLRRNQVWVTVILRYLGRNLTEDFQRRGDRIFRDLRGYLIGSTPGI
jgi:serine/threonine-protein kinase